MRKAAELADYGFGDYVFHRTGHVIGLGGHEYWHDMVFNHRIMKPNMVTTVESMLCIYGFRHPDTVVIGSDKPIFLTKFPKDLDYLTVLT